MKKLLTGLLTLSSISSFAFNSDNFSYDVELFNGDQMAVFNDVTISVLDKEYRLVNSSQSNYNFCTSQGYSKTLGDLNEASSFIESSHSNYYLFRVEDKSESHDYVLEDGSGISLIDGSEHSYYMTRVVCAKKQVEVTVKFEKN